MNKFELAKNPNTSADVLEKLAFDKDWLVRMCVACNPNTSPKVLEKLANDEVVDVRDAVAENPNTPKYIKTYMYYQLL
jgi:hypothetical protein